MLTENAKCFLQAEGKEFNKSENQKKKNLPEFACGKLPTKQR